MQQFLKWTLESIRADGAQLSWLEELRFSFSATASKAIKQILEGKTMVVVTDSDRKWFEQYLLCTINRSINERPMIPVSSIESIYPDYGTKNGPEVIEMLEDMLELAYSGRYFFFYIGKGSDVRSDIAKRSSNSLMWLLDEESTEAISLRSYDEFLDIKLLQLFRQFDKTLNAVLFGEVDADE